MCAPFHKAGRLVLRALVMVIHTSRIGCLPLFAWCLLLAGCHDGDRAEVAGTVTLGGKPLAEGLVTFRPAAGTSGPEFSGTISEGKYRVAIVCLPGDYVVDVRAWQKTGRVVKGPFGNDVEEIVNVIPQRYWGPGTTLSAHLVSGANEADFNLIP